MLFLKTACKRPDILEEVFILLSELNNSLPQIHEEKDLIPEQPSLQWSLQDLYEDYIDYCIAVIRYLHEKSSSEFPPKKDLISLPSLIISSEHVEVILDLNSAPKLAKNKR